MLIFFIHENILFVHAGVTKTWCEIWDIDLKGNIEQQINDLFKFKPRAFCFTMGDNYDQTGDDVCQSPIWVRPRSLHNDRIPNYVQIVGHTQVEKIASYKDEIFLTDCLPREYLVIENGKFIIKQLK